MDTRLTVLLAGTLAAAAGGLATAPAAFAGDTECRGTLGAVTVVGNLLVPDDSTCTLEGTEVIGSITVKSRATLLGTGITVSGGMQGESPTSVVLRASELGNGVSLRKAGEGGRLDIRTTSITGDLALAENRGAVELRDNDVTGSVQADKNSGGTVVATNVIGNGLQCQDNAPPPTGGGNIATQKQGQCLRL